MCGRQRRVGETGGCRVIVSPVFPMCTVVSSGSGPISVEVGHCAEVHQQCWSRKEADNGSKETIYTVNVDEID